MLGIYPTAHTELAVHAKELRLTETLLLIYGKHIKTVREINTRKDSDWRGRTSRLI